MKVLVTSTPGVGHVLPLMPIATALQAAGHEVTWATGPDAQHRIREAGLDPVPAGTDQATRMGRLTRGWPEIADLPPRQRRTVVFPTAFATLSADAMFDDLGTLAAERDVDLVVHEPCELAAAPLAHLLGVPHATVGFGRFIPDDLLRLAADRLVDLWARAGRDVPDDLGLYDFAYFHPLPRSFESIDAQRPVHLVRPAGNDDRAAAGAQPRDRPGGVRHVRDGIRACRSLVPCRRRDRIARRRRAPDGGRASRPPVVRTAAPRRAGRAVGAATRGDGRE